MSTLQQRVPAINKEEYSCQCRRPVVYATPQGEVDYKAKAVVEQQNNLATCSHAHRKWKGSGSKTSQISAVSDEKIIHRTNAVTACLQAGLSFAMINLAPMIPNIVYTCHSVDNAAIV